MLTYAKRYDESVVSSGGAIVDIVMGSSASVANSNVVFCILVDDLKLKYNSASTTSMSSGSLHDRYSSKQDSPYSLDFMVFKNGAFFGTELRRNNQSSQGVTNLRDDFLRASSVAYHPSAGFVYTAGNTLRSLGAQGHISKLIVSGSTSSISSLSSFLPTPLVYYDADLASMTSTFANDTPSKYPGSLSLVCQGRVAVLLSGNSFYAIPSIAGKNSESGANLQAIARHIVEPTQIVTFSQSGQMHATIVTEISTTKEQSSNTTSTNLNMSRRAITTMIFLALGRDCTACELLYDARHASVMLATSNTIANLSSPIMSASTICDSSRPLVAILTSDGLIHIRSPSCLAVPLSIVGKSRFLMKSFCYKI